MSPIGQTGLVDQAEEKRGNELSGAEVDVTPPSHASLPRGGAMTLEPKWCLNPSSAEMVPVFTVARFSLPYKKEVDVFVGFFSYN